MASGVGSPFLKRWELCYPNLTEYISIKQPIYNNQTKQRLQERNRLEQLEKNNRGLYLFYSRRPRPYFMQIYIRPL